MSRLFCITACSMSLMGCVFRDFDYQEPPNLPPSVESSETGPTPLNRVIDIIGDGSGLTDGGGPGETRFEAEVRDANVGDTLTARLYLNRDPDLDLIDSFEGELDPILPVLEPDPRRRTVAFTIPNSRFADGCNLVELFVSSEFAPAPSLTPRLAGDIGSAAWWIAKRESAEDPVDMGACPP